jgi:hypothetical protein
MRGSRAVKLVMEGNDTLTESCGDAVNFMVIEMRDRSLQKLHLWECRENRMWAAQVEGCSTDQIFCFYRKERSPDFGRTALLILSFLPRMNLKLQEAL